MYTAAQLLAGRFLPGSAAHAYRLTQIAHESPDSVGVHDASGWWLFGPIFIRRLSSTLARYMSDSALRIFTYSSNTQSNF